MRRLIDHLWSARAVHRANGERGAVAIVTALSLVVLLGFAAIAIDVGMLYEERAQLQSGADAAAMAVAQDCAAGTNCLNTASVLPAAQQMADTNSRDNRSAAAILELNKGQRKVRVQTSTVDGQGGAGSLALSFAPVLGIDDATVGATATAVWGSPEAGIAAFPIAFAACEFDLSGAPQVLVLGGKGPSRCPESKNTGHNTDLPGGFGWIGDDPKDACGVPVAVGKNIKSSTGSSLPQGCTDSLTESALKNQILLIPVYDSVSGPGDKGTYHISGWAAFRIEGYTFTGGVAWNPTKVTGACGKNCDGVYGRFVRFVSVDPGFDLGPPTSYGATVVKLSD
ncbi:pilus assembly protein TadG-related protein [Streptomyces sp.]|uniref:pilus assembly protein TadG-related protein n=1 Tax=Streptomyces sp. TaxID=1931 RepID=UPI0028127E08|nr:pilus assembly protein TadG-related protein [Streptomyces sp.]